MKFLALGFLVIGLVLLSVQAAPEPEPEPERGQSNGRLGNYRAANVNIQKDETILADLSEDDGNDTPSKSDSSSGRLFLKKFFSKNLFGSSQPVIPIIITGASTATNPTTTITSTGTVPTATGTITTSPITTTARDLYENDSQDDEEEAEQLMNDADTNLAINEQTLQAALAAGAQEYVVTDEEIKGTADSKTKQTNRVNLRRKNNRKGQVISIRIPPKYRRYFKNGQKVLLNTENPPVRRRLVKKRVNVNKNKNNKNRRRVNINNNKNRFIAV